MYYRVKRDTAYFDKGDILNIEFGHTFGNFPNAASVVIDLKGYKSAHMHFSGMPGFVVFPFDSDYLETVGVAWEKEFDDL